MSSKQSKSETCNICVEQNKLIYLLCTKENTATIIGNKSATGHLIIPRSIFYESKEFIITSISSRSFLSSAIKSIQFSPNSELQTIEKEAFSCSLIEKFTIPPHLTTIGESAFSDCKKLFKFEIPANSQLETIEKGAFAHSSINEFTIPLHLTKIGEGAFFACRNLIIVHIHPESDLCIIEKYAFTATSILSFTVPHHLTTIEQGAFINSRRLSIFEIPENSELHTIGEAAFCGTQINCLTFPSNLVNLEEGWCLESSKLTRIMVSSDNPRYCVYDDKMIIGKSSIEQDNYDVVVFCFRDVEHVKIPNFIRIIDSYAFSECQKLKSVEFTSDSELHTINKYSFSCSSITNFSIPPSLKLISKKAFECCILQNIIIPSNSQLQTIEEDAFYDTKFMSLKIPNSLVDLKEGWNLNKYNLYKIIVMPKNPMYSCVDDKILIRKQSIEKNEYDVFTFCVQSIKNVLIPSFIKIIDSYAFFGCDVQNVEISSDSQLQTINKSAFLHSSIESLSIPSNLIDLKEGWCNRTPLLHKITVSSNNQRYCVYDDKMIIGKSSIEQDNYDVVVFCFRDVEHVKIPNFIRIIDSYAFSECKKLKSVEFTSDSELHAINKYSFSCSSITNFSIPRSVKIIGEHCFSNCNQLQKIDIPFNSQLQIIDEYAFNFSGIHYFSAPPQLTKICKMAFNYCTQLQKFEIPFNSELQVVGISAFDGTSIECFTIPSKLNQIGKFAFSGEYLKIIEINENNEMEYIDKHIFGYNKLNIIIMLPTELSGHFNMIFPYLEGTF